jgi:hypothetical protein
MMTMAEPLARTTPVLPRAKTAPATHMDIAALALRKAGCSDDSQQPQFLVRYAELKHCAPAQLEQWLTSLTQTSMRIVRYVLETVVADCRGDIDALTARPFKAADDQMKLVPQFVSDGSPLVNFRMARLNTVDAIDDALGAEFIPTLRA